jgi:hypothetical protein
MRCPLDWEIYRKPSPFDGEDMGDRHNGYLRIPARDMAIVFSNGGGWEHVSVSHPDRTPTWEEMDDVKRRFWQETDTVMQLHVPPAQHKNCHPHCLHLWRPLIAEIPRPPSIYVAP